MRGVETEQGVVHKIKELRSFGYSINEIASLVNKSKSVISKYIKNVKIIPEYKEVLKIKQGGSKMRSSIKWENARKEASNIFLDLNKKERLLVLSALYWGEGTKRELNIINSDPEMLRFFIFAIKELGVKDNQIRVSLRIYDDINPKKSIDFWSKSLNMPKSSFKHINILKGKKTGKLKFGMCRVRVEKSEKYFKLIISLINRIKELSPRSSMDRTAHS